TDGKGITLTKIYDPVGLRQHILAPKGAYQGHPLPGGLLFIKSRLFKAASAKCLRHFQNPTPNMEKRMDHTVITTQEDKRAKPDDDQCEKPVRYFTDDDRDIADFLDDRVATPRQVAIGVGRNEKGIRRRLFELSEGEPPWIERMEVGRLTYYSTGF